MKGFIRIAGEFRDSFFMAMGALVSHKLRSALTLLGVAIGVFSIIVVMTTMRAMEKSIEKNFARLGAQTFQVSRWPGVSFGGSYDEQAYYRRPRITLEMAEEVIRRAKLPQSIGLQTGMGRFTMRSRYGDGPPNVWLVGATSGTFPSRNWTIDEGRLLVDSDVDNAKDVCVLASKLAGQLFPHSSALGEEISVSGGSKYKVVGVLESNGSMPGGMQDNFAVIPITTGLNRYYQKQYVDLNILVETQSADLYDETVDEVSGILRMLRKVPPGQPNDFEVFSDDSMIQQFQAFTFKVRLGVSLISSIALLAAGIGIMNIMLVSVTERTREIGIRRAIGAKRRSIMTQFIMEAVVLCEVGGVAGVILGVGGGELLASLLKLTPVIPVDWVLIGLGLCSLVGIIFGTYPARKAAYMDPVESLRYE